MTKKKICVKVYLNPNNFPRYATGAELAGKRRGGLPLFTQVPHGFADEKLANTDGLGRFFKMAADFWLEHRAELEVEARDVKEREARLKKYGVV